MYTSNNDEILLTNKKQLLSKREAPVKKGVSFLKSKNVSQIVIPVQSVMSDFDKKLKEVCMEYSIKYTIVDNKVICNDWFAISETEDRLNGVAKGNIVKIAESCHLLDKKITLIYTTLVNNIKNVQEKCEHCICVISTIEEFFSSINSLANMFSREFLLRPYKGKEDEAKKIFKKLLGDNANTESLPIDDVKLMITNFNNMHPSWAFIKSKHDKDTTNLKVPYRRDNNITLNEINLNIKETTKLRSDNLVISNAKYEGFLDYLLLDFIGGSFPKDIVGLIFQKTISMKINKQVYIKNLVRSYFNGLRIRILVDADIPIENYKKIFDEFKTFIQDRYIKFQPMIVSLTIPKI